jgi:hypothetical protein
MLRPSTSSGSSSINAASKSICGDGGGYWNRMASSVSSSLSPCTAPSTSCCVQAAGRCTCTEVAAQFGRLGVHHVDIAGARVIIAGDQGGQPRNVTRLAPPVDARATNSAVIVPYRSEQKGSSHS